MIDQSHPEEWSPSTLYLCSQNKATLLIETIDKNSPYDRTFRAIGWYTVTMLLNCVGYIVYCIV
jgi:hypothetical protein